ncbi:MAG: DNRLRE domain-containing protein, partial [Thermoplasmata archaeon]|nr:DNRLRE domain-containing protein [Thermoplasmata archaeon]
MSRTPSNRGVSTTKPTRSRRFPSILVCATMMLVPLLALVPSASSDHIIIDNPDYTNTVQWNMDDPEDYQLMNATISDGRATLTWLTESHTETTGTDFASGYLTNIDVASQPGSIILEERTTFTSTITIEPDDTTGWDTFINEDRETDNYGADKDLRLDSEIGRVLRVLLRFDLDDIPSTAVVNSAILGLYELAGGKGDDVTFNIHSLEVPFSADMATWLRPSASEFWATPGGDYSPEVYFNDTFDNTVGWRSLDITTMVECWVKGYLENNGMIFVPEEMGGDALKLFASADETGSPQYRPRLIVNYTIQGNEGVYESGLIGPTTMATFTTASWSKGMLSLLDDEFNGTSLSSKWTWWNDPVVGGGSYNVGITTPGWLRVTGESNTQNIDSTIDSNFVYQDVVGDFSATTSLREFFAINSMDTGMMVVDGNTSWLSISKSDTGVNGKIRVVACEDGVSETKANFAWSDMSTAQLKIVRNSTGLWLYVSEDGVGWTYVYQHDPDLVMRQRIKVGLFLASGSTSQPVTEFNFFRVKPLTTSGAQLMIKTGNSSSLSDPSWTDWSATLPGNSVALDVDARYLRYRVYISTPAEWYTPIFYEFSTGWERYAQIGVVMSHDFTPTDFSIWLTLHAEHDDSNGQIEYYYSVDEGDSWVFSTSGAMGAVYSIQPSIRIRAVITSFDTLTTPSIDSFSVVFGTSLSTFYIETPSEVVAGENFDVDLWVKNSENETMSYWVGAVSMQAMNAAGTGLASADLETTTATITSAGYLHLTTQRYHIAETIRIQVASGGSFGLSEAIVVHPAPVASIEFSPEGLETVLEGTKTTLHATALDEYGNDVPDAELTWTITSGLGSLSAYTSDSVVFTAGDPYQSGYINVTSGSVTISVFISIEDIGHPPAILTPVPDQTAVEDGPTWTYDLGPHVYDPIDPDSELRWFVTNETLVTASNENKTGDMQLMLTPNPDMFGSNTLKLFVVDREGSFAETEFVVSIEPVNDGPTIDAIWPLVVRYDMAYAYNLKYYITDIDNEDSDLQLSVDSASLPYVVVGADSLSIIITYPLSMVGTTQSIVVTVSDGELTGSTIIDVTVSTDNVPVLIENLPDVALYQGEAMLNAFDLDDYFMDPDEDMLYYVTGQTHVFV